MYEVKKSYKFKELLLIPFEASPANSMILVIFSILDGIVPIAQIVVLTKFINTAIIIVQEKTSISNIYLPILYMCLLVGYQWLSEEMSNFAKIKISLAIRSTFCTAVTEKIAKLNYSNIEDNDTWNLINRVLSKLENELCNAFINVLSLVSLTINVIGIVAIIFTYIWWAALIIMGLLIPLCCIAVKGAKQNYNAEREISEAIRKYEYLSEVLTGREAVEERTLFGFTKKVNVDYKNAYDNAYKIRLKTRAKWFLKMKAGSIVTSIVSVLTIFVFLKPVLNGEVTAGFFISIVKGIFSLIQKMSWSITYYIDQIATQNEYLKDLNMLLSLDETPGAIDLPIKAIQNFESIEFKDVYFKYPKTEKYILNGMCFKIDRNKHYAFVGINGAGKTTITKLICGLYNNYEGTILINGVDIKKYAQSELKSIASVLYQDFAKYYISLKDNIAIGNISGRENKDIDEKVMKALDSVSLTEKAGNLKEGINTPLGKIKANGQDLSGGEWQRVAIARCLMNPAPLKILDEPTAALDPISESELYEEFAGVTKQYTTILISHRLGSTKLADEILVIGEGKIIEKGTHEELLNNKSVYSVMYNNQKDWYVK